MSTLTVPINIRNKMNPRLYKDSIGNSIAHATTRTSALQLTTPIELSNLCDLVKLIRKSITATNSRSIRSKVATFNVCEAVDGISIPSKNFDYNLVITSWDDIALGDAHLGLGMFFSIYYGQVRRTTYQLQDRCRYLQKP